MAEAEIPNFERDISLTKCGKFVPKREMPRLGPRARSVERSGDQKGFVRRDHGWMDGRPHRERGQSTAFKGKKEEGWDGGTEK